MSLKAGQVLAGQRAFSSVSVIIPSYRGSARLVELVKTLLRSGYPGLEVIVVVDEPREDVASELAKLNDVRVVFNTERKGKVHALNTALKMAHGELVVFLDDDVEVRDPAFIEKVASEMRGFDVGDIKKVIVGKGLLAKMVAIEYVAVNFASKLMARASQRTVVINGAAFAMTRRALEEVGFFRPVISEDFDLAVRSFLRGHKYTYIESTFVYNHAPLSWRKWYEQRKRWAIGAAEWVRDNLWVALKALASMPHAVLPGLLITLPSLVSSTIPFLLDNHTVAKVLYLVLLYFSSVVSQVIPFATALSLNLQLLYYLSLVIVLAVFAAWHYIASKYVRMKSYLYLYPLYFFFYQPLWLTILAAGFIRVLVLKRADLENWVV